MSLESLDCKVRDYLSVLRHLGEHASIMISKAVAKAFFEDVGYSWAEGLLMDEVLSTHSYNRESRNT